MHELPADWTDARVKDVVDPARHVTYGIVQPGPRQREDVGVPVIRGQDYSGGVVATEGLYHVLPHIAASYSRSTVKTGDLILSIVGYVGNASQVPGELDGANLTQTTARVAIRNGLSSRFFLHFFRGRAFQHEVSRFTKGSAQPGLNLGDVEVMRVAYPPLREQRRIAEILDTVDEAIRKTEEIIAKLKQVKQGLLHDLLTRGIDDNGELRDPDRHPEQFKDSPLGRIPKAWEVAPLRDGIDFITDYRGATPPYSNEGIPVISAENVGDGKVKSTTKWVTPEVYRRTSTRGFPAAGDTIFTTEAPVGEVARVPGDRPYRLTRRVLALRPKRNWWRKHYLFWFIYHRSRSGAWDAFMHGSTVPRILKPDILARPIARPTLAEQQAVEAMLDEHDKRLASEEEWSSKLRDMKQGLGEDLLTGRVRTETSSRYRVADGARQRARGRTTTKTSEVAPSVEPEVMEGGQAGTRGGTC